MRISQRVSLASYQLYCLWFELRRMNNIHWHRWISCWFTASFWAVASYRISRALYLLLGKGWQVLRVIFSPVIFLLKPWIGTTEIHFKAKIGKGLIVLHPTLGIVISGHATIGENLTLTGGNCIGGRKILKPNDLLIGNNVSLGANAVILGPVHIGNNVKIGAGAVVVTDAPDGAVMVGIPAVNIAKTDK